MTRRFCDRCGEVLPTFPNIFNVEFPLVEIKIRKVIDEGVSIDLCSKCKCDFVNWLRNGEVKNDDKD